MFRTVMRRSWSTLLLLATVFSNPLSAQQFIELGAGVSTNQPIEFPAPYGNQQNGARHQVLVLASELTALGMSSGDILGVGFHVDVPLAVPLSDMTVRVGATSVNSLTTAWETGLSTVWGPLDLNSTAGWNDHVFGTPFFWDGVSNLIIETCFRNLGFSQNAQHFRTQTGFNSVVYRSSSNTNICTSNFGNLNTSIQRPDLRFIWQPPMVAPVAAFTYGPAFSCTGSVQFTDASEFFPDSWAWDFGDGTTDTVPAPLHQYQSDGMFDVSLTVTNPFGQDQVVVLGAVEVNTSGPRPIDACEPLNTPNINGFGILEVSYANTVQSSGDAVEEGGYVDRSCLLDTLMVGTTLDLNVITGNVTTHNVKAWVDWDGSGTFSASELVLSANSVNNAGSSLTVPTSTLLDTPLRLRVMSDYDLSAPLSACVPSSFGQTEDYGLVIIANPMPPVAQFTAEPLFSCDGQVQFDDASLNGPTGWSWDFGDGNGSGQASVLHTYQSSGVYTVTLNVTNGNGSDQLVLTDLITVDLDGQLVPALCTPQTVNHCCGYGIDEVVFAGINSSSADGSEGYQDRSCGQVAAIEEGALVPVSIGTSGALTHDTYMWIDMDNNGAFANNELLFFALSQTDPSGTVQIPAGTVFNTPLRMRLAADVIGELTGPCDQPLHGQVEDFSVIIEPTTAIPVAFFSASPVVTCDGIVQFTDLSLNLIDSWSWDFGDGTGSSDQDPLHVYANPGVYDVSLTVSNANGSDTYSLSALIDFSPDNPCDTAAMPANGNALLTDCAGVLTDDGGVDADYSPGMSGVVTIAPPGAELVTLSFSQFAFEPNFDFLRIFDGPDDQAPLIGSFSGLGIGNLPNNGIITSTGPSIALQQAASPGQMTFDGFILTWNCSFTSIEETFEQVASVFPVPTEDRLHVRLTGPARSGTIITINDLLGELIESRALDAGDMQAIFDARPWASGMYILNIANTEGRWSRPIVVH
ncbi:MAG: PKD domain-containing protein [Flavobacteriales bacterium]|nr:PKD domain-containing protein [Flavobacteriales bacterium]